MLQKIDFDKLLFFICIVDALTLFVSLLWAFCLNGHRRKTFEITLEKLALLQCVVNSKGTICWVFDELKLLIEYLLLVEKIVMSKKQSLRHCINYLQINRFIWMNKLVKVFIFPSFAMRMLESTPLYTKLLSCILLRNRS